MRSKGVRILAPSPENRGGAKFTGQDSFSNLLTFSPLYDSISRGEKSPVIILFMNQPPGVAAPLTGAFSFINKLCSAGCRSTVQHWPALSRWLGETRPGAIRKRYPPLAGRTISLRDDILPAARRYPRVPRGREKRPFCNGRSSFGWRRGELNPCPKIYSYPALRA